MTKRELLKKLDALAPLTDDQRNAVTCSLIGHSKIQDCCFGQFTCGRCGDVVGDALMSVYPGAATVVVIGHNCETCRENYKKTNWRDRLFVANPFKSEEVPA